MFEKTTSEKIRQECSAILDSENLLGNCNAEFIAKYRKLFQIKQIRLILDNSELLGSARVFMDNDLNITKASKEGYMHRNTLIYRIEKIRRLVGLDLRKFKDAAVFENLIAYYELVKNSDQNQNNEIEWN